MTKTTLKHSGAAKGAGAKSKHRKSVRPTARKPTSPQMKPPRAAASTAVASSNQQRPETKQARVIAMLRGPAGATMDTMMRATGWQPHSVRGGSQPVNPLERPLGYDGWAQIPLEHGPLEAYLITFDAI